MFMRPASSRGIRSALASLLAAAALAGCAGPGSLEPGEAGAILAQGKTIVLMRLTATNDGRPFDAISSLESVESYTLNLVDLGGERRETVGPMFRSPDEASRAEGWISIAVPPGSYFLQLFAPWGSAGERQERSWTDNRYRISVPAAGGVQYAGSFSVACRSTWGLLGPQVGDCPGPLRLTDESEAARAVSLRAFGQAPAFQAKLPAAYDAPPRESEILRASPFRVEVGAASPWQPPDWERLNDRTSPPEPGSGMGGGGGGGCYGPGCGGLALIALAFWLGAEAVDEAQDRATQARWAPCVHALAREVARMKAPELLRGQVAGAVGAAGGDAARGVLKIDLRRVLLRKCREPESVCVEVAAHARLTETASGAVVYDATHVYTSADAVPTGGYPPRPFGTAPLLNHLAWETPVDGPSPCFGLEAICGRAGLERFRAELDKGLGAIAARIAGDLGRSGGW
jgi:hypothetical protein